MEAMKHENMITQQVTEEDAKVKQVITFYMVLKC